MYFHTDLNGCPEELTDANGKILWECSFQLWGKRIHEIEHEPIEQNLRYQGQYLDRETGLHYNTFRYYDPDIGRFTQPDPIGLLGGLNLYQYAFNSLMWIDPLGLAPCAKVSEFDRIKSGKVYRVIRQDENISSGLFSLNPNNIKTVAGHVTSGSRSPSQFISATKDLSIAEKWASKTGNRIVEIDLSKISGGAIDISSTKGLDLLGNQFATRLAKGSSEVLFDAPIPANAIKLIRYFMKIINSDVNEKIIGVVEKIRLLDKLDEQTMNDLYTSLDEMVTNYKEKNFISKELAYNLLVLHDNLEGALNFGSYEDMEYISNINSKVSEYIEKIFLS